VRIGVLVVAAWAATVASSVPSAEAPRARPQAAASSPVAVDVASTVDRYCVSCHNSRAKTTATASGVVFDGIDPARIADDSAMWEKVIRKLRTRSMPPTGVPRPDESTYTALVSHLESTLDRAAAAHPNPGRPAVHRLNRAEYANAIRDLLALEVDPAALLPPDDSVNGFDNNADMLSVSPALLERYLAAAATISAIAVGSPNIAASSETYRIRGDASQTGRNEALPPGTRGGLMARHTFPLDGEYVIKIKLLDSRSRVREPPRSDR
jgi:hypothetical protein